jgi:predicted signal transduction protein with EAL and GGDEF domain
VAEGVEASAQADALHDAGCAFGQGFHFAHPMEAAGIDDLLGIAPARSRSARLPRPDGVVVPRPPGVQPSPAS